MVKKVKTFIIFLLFSFLYSLLAGRLSTSSKTGCKSGLLVGTAHAGQICCLTHTKIEGDPCY